MSYSETQRRHARIFSLIALVSIAFVFFLVKITVGAEEEADPAEVTIGERLFLETRFAQFFMAFVNSGHTVNESLPQGDPVLEKTLTATGQSLPGPFAGTSMNCRTCHLVDEHLDTPGGGMRAYSDFARRSSVPHRADDNRDDAARNAPSLVNISGRPAAGTLFHFDGEFLTLEDLIKATFTGRNLGYFINEKKAAISHIARVIREDDGKGTLAGDFGGLSYAVLFDGTDQNIPSELQLPERFRLDVTHATDRKIFNTVAKLVTAYIESLEFAKDGNGNFNLSPYDVFLEKNNFPRQPNKREDPIDYSRRLLGLIQEREQIGQLEFVHRNPHTENGGFKFQQQSFRFGQRELDGLKIFFSQPERLPIRPSQLVRGGQGNCIACHAAPVFSDFGFHNTGVSQAEYDVIHGLGAFQRLPIPDLHDRNRSPNDYLPATEEHPEAQEPFRAVPSAQDSTLVDLGVWNIFANPDFPKPQHTILRILCSQHRGSRLDEDQHTRCTRRHLLGTAIAAFKTPGLRDLGHTAPYLHNGRLDTIESVLDSYQRNSQLARDGNLRNADPELQGIVLLDQNRAPLAAFLRALNEDYE